MTPETLAARIRNLLASESSVCLYAKEDSYGNILLYAGYLMADRDDEDVFVADVTM